VRATFSRSFFIFDEVRNRELWRRRAVTAKVVHVQAGADAGGMVFVGENRAEGQAAASAALRTMSGVVGKRLVGEVAARCGRDHNGFVRPMRRAPYWWRARGDSKRLR